jgi:hypothetical protein
MDINILAVTAAALSAFVLGGLWYSPILFGKKWQALAGLSDEDLQAANPAVKFGFSFVLVFVAAFVFSVFLGPEPALSYASGAGFAAGLGWVATSFGINYLFEHKSMGLFLINGGYHTVQFTLIGAILGLWH